MSERHSVQEETLRNWANLGYITSSRIGNQLFLDNESLIAYLEAHQRLGVQEDYLAKIVEEKKLERDFVISKYDDLLYVLRTQHSCKPLFEIIIRELSGLIVHPGHRDIFYSISLGESIARVAGQHRMTYERVLQVYESLLEGLKRKGYFLASYRKLAMDFRFQSLTDKKSMPIKYDKRILQLPINKVANTRMTNVLQQQGISTVGQLLEMMVEKEWDSLLEIEGVGKVCYRNLLANLQKAGVKDERLERTLSLPTHLRTM